MAFDFSENLAISKILMSKKNPSGKYSLNGKEVSYDALNATLSDNMKELTHTNGKFDIYKYNANKNTIFQLLGETLNDVMPKNVIDNYGMFCDVQTIPQGDTIVFHHKLGKRRAKQFITRVAHAGRYEVFELADEKFTMQTTAYGGAARIGIEEFLDGRVQWSDYLDIINEGMKEVVYQEAMKALTGAIKAFPAANRVVSKDFSEDMLDYAINTAAVYGSPVIYCTMKAALKIKPADGSSWISESMKNERWEKGYFAKYKGVPVVILPNSFVDETNTTWQMDSSNYYVFPTNGEKPIKIAFEGQTLVEEFKNRDWSTELHTYQKFGVAIYNTNDLVVYHLTSLEDRHNVPPTGTGYGPWDGNYEYKANALK